MDYEQPHGTNEGDTANAFPELTPAVAASGAAPGATRAGVVTLRPDADNVVVLPDGVNLDDVRVSGRDLVVELPDGRTIVIPDGAVFVPVLVIESVALPPLNLAAYLNGDQPQPAAGTPQSSGGNFADPAGPIQDAFGIGNLLPYTELAFEQQQDEEVLPFIDNKPAITFVPEVGDGTEVRESHLPSTTPTRNGESQGSQFDGNSETTTSTITFVSRDGVGSVEINGVRIDNGGGTKTVVTDQVGTMVVTGYSFDSVTGTGTITYTYTLNDNTLSTNGGAQVDVPITVVDRDGDVTNDTLVIRIIDDVPTARPDQNSVHEGGTAS